MLSVVKPIFRIAVETKLNVAVVVTIIVVVMVVVVVIAALKAKGIALVMSFGDLLKPVQVMAFTN